MNPDTVVDPKLTPMMEQYRSIKKTLPSDTILFFRLGDFYEMFFDDAIRASEILNITLTGRGGGEAGRVPMCGIPYHAFQGYVRTLIDHSLKVAICEQIGDPKAAKGLVERKVTRIISPATYLEEEDKTKNAEYLSAVMSDGTSCAIAYLELSTGEFFVREIDAGRLTGELSILSPREVVFSKTLADKSALAAFVKGDLHATLTVYEDWVFEREEAARLIGEFFGFASEKSIPFYDRPLAVGATGAVLYYLRDHLHSAVGHIRPPEILDTKEFMVLDRQTQRSLELVTGMNEKKSGAYLLACLDQTLTSMGARTLQQWLTQPLLSIPEIQKRQDGVSELVRDSETAQTLRKLFQGVKDMERTLSRLNYGVANGRDLVNLKAFLERVPELETVLATTKSAALQGLRGAIRPFPGIRELIARAIVELPPLGLRDGGIIRDGHSKDLDEWREISRHGKSWIAEFEQREIERTGIRSLKVKYSQVFGYTIDISNANLHLVPPDYIRRQTLANAERFVVPELTTWDEKITGAQDKIKALEYQLFNEVRAKVLEDLAPLQGMARAVGILDALCSLAIAAVQKKWVRPEVTDLVEIKIEGGRHPVVELMLPSGRFVENETLLDGSENQLVVLTGPNMAGKSTYIRQVAQIVLLAQMGSFVPAARARIGLVDRIFTRIGATDDLAQGESTFMVEMLETAHILRSATSRSLLILDEVGRGTSTFDGVSIAWAICEFLAQGKVRPQTLFATHYHELTQLEDHFQAIKNYHITVRETKEGIIFLRKVVRGGSDRSYGIHVARLAGIPSEVTTRAEQILEILESENTEATEIIERKKEKKTKKEDSLQGTFFSLPAAGHPLIEEIQKLAIDGLTPLEALNKIAEWKKKAEKGT